METKRKQCSLGPMGSSLMKGHFTIPTVTTKNSLGADMPALSPCSHIIMKKRSPSKLSSVNSSSRESPQMIGLLGKIKEMTHGKEPYKSLQRTM